MWPVPAQADGQRLDAALAALSGMSRATCAGLIEQGRVRRTATQRFDADGAAPCAEIGETGTGDSWFQHGKERFADAIGHRTRPG